MTYNVFGGTLNLAQSTYYGCMCYSLLHIKPRNVDQRNILNYTVS